MKHITSALVSLFLLAGATTASAATIWAPTDGTVNTLSIHFYGPSGSFGLFDDSTAIGSASAPDLAITGSDVITFIANGSNWDVSSQNTSDTHTLSGSNWFQFGFNSVGSGSNWEGDNGSPSWTGGMWQLFFPSAPGTVLFAADVTPVPLPGGIALFFSGILALMVIVSPRRGRVQPSTPAFQA